jgi:hypothetical protein
MHANPIRVGLVFGLFLAVYHACWSALVFTGFAQRFLDFIFWAHFIAPIYRVEPFELARAGILIGVVFGVGLAFGIVAALIWNALHPRANQT